MTEADINPVVGLDKAYAPKLIEEKWVSAWKKAKLFSPGSELSAKPKFVIAIPPPNVTGALHLGHALNNTLQDVLIRWRRMSGDQTCWVPGTDHGGIATQNVMEKQLKSENLSRHDIGREKFLARMQEWTKECKKTILGQLERLGCALDFSREAYTMDEPRARSVRAAFETLWNKGLIYRGCRMVNWCVRCGTSLSDIEVEHEERKGHLWHIHYPLADNSEGVVVATTRPETLLGDTAVAVNPKDSRHAHLIGKKLRLPLLGREIPVVADEAVDMKFGTGAVKVTPAHDPTDFEIGERHGLAAITVISIDGRISAEGGLYAGLSREQARDKIVEDLKASALLRKEEDYRHAIGVCYRCASPIEPLVSLQWFVRMKELAQPALAALEDGRFEICPESWSKPYRDWLSGIKDWNISRQIWWGHRIPVWYCLDCNDLASRPFHQAGDLKGMVSDQKPTVCSHCGSKKGNFMQDPDVLDTWFSSSLWPMSIFGWPEKSPDFAAYYPTSVLVTGYEILYLWVARMQMMGLFFTGKPPFKQAVIHGIVRDKSGRKMSKSLGNVVDPLVLMDKVGTDALRFSLMRDARLGKDIHFSEEALTGSRNFVNKIWNTARFALMNIPPNSNRSYSLDKIDRASLDLADRWILSRYERLVGDITTKMASFEIAEAVQELYGFLWDEFCDWYVELAKMRLAGAAQGDKDSCCAILIQVLCGTLKMLHPFMPFITDELYVQLKPYAGESAAFLLNAAFPQTAPEWRDAKAEEQMSAVMEMTGAIRALRAQLNVPPGLKIRAIAIGGGQDVRALAREQAGYMRVLARLEDIEFADGQESRRPQSATALARGMAFLIPLSGVIDFAKERARLEKELAKAESDVKKIAAKVENPDFLKHAQAEEVDTARAQYQAAKERTSRLKETLSSVLN